jgi:hypothetical protein
MTPPTIATAKQIATDHRAVGALVLTFGTGGDIQVTMHNGGRDRITIPGGEVLIIDSSPTWRVTEMSKRDAKMIAMLSAATLVEEATETEIFEGRDYTEEEVAKLLEALQLIAEGLWKKYERMLPS